MPPTHDRTVAKDPSDAEPMRPDAVVTQHTAAPAPVAPWRTAVADAVGTVREHALDFALVVLGSTIPRLLRKTLLGLRLAGLGLVALGAFAVLRPVEFVRFLPYLMGGVFLLLGGLAFYVAMRIQEATSAVRLAEKAIEAFRERARPPAP